MAVVLFIFSLPFWKNSVAFLLVRSLLFFPVSLNLAPAWSLCCSISLLCVQSFAPSFSVTLFFRHSHTGWSFPPSPASTVAHVLLLVWRHPIQSVPQATAQLWFWITDPPRPLFLLVRVRVRKCGSYFPSAWVRGSLLCTPGFIAPHQRKWPVSRWFSYTKCSRWASPLLMFVKITCGFETMR